MIDVNSQYQLSVKKCLLNGVQYTLGPPDNLQLPKASADSPVQKKTGQTPGLFLEVERIELSSLDNFSINDYMLIIFSSRLLLMEDAPQGNNPPF